MKSTLATATRSRSPFGQKLNVKESDTHSLTYTRTHTHTCSHSVCMRCLPPAFPKDARVKQRDSAGGGSTEKISKLHSEDKGGTLITRQGVNGVGRGKGGGELVTKGEPEVGPASALNRFVDLLANFRFCHLPPPRAPPRPAL